MWHTIKRLAVTIASGAQIALVFGLFGFVMALASNSWEPMAVMLVWACVFFAPAAMDNAWEEFGD